MMLLTGLVGVAAGLMTIFHPGLTGLVLVLLIGANAIVTGVLEVSLAVRLRRVITGEWLLAVSGVLAIVFGVLLFLFPAAGALAIVWLFSFYATLSGLLLIALAVRVHSLGRTAAGRVHLGRAPDRRHGFQL
jgi:uncharacterized membrane protein HdeD (DUF308 family)